MRIHCVVFGLCLVGCASSSAIQPTELVGTWTGTQSNGKTYRYTFDAAQHFEYGPMLDSGFVSLANGKVTVDGEQLVLDSAITDESGAQSFVRMTLDAHVSSAGLCVGLYRSQSGGDLVGRWTSDSTVQALDANGAPTGDPQDNFDAIVTYADGTYIKDSGESGTWEHTADTITFKTAPSHGTYAVRGFKLVDDVMCDPLFTH
jgi:hypothetical protein